MMDPTDPGTTVDPSSENDIESFWITIEENTYIANIEDLAISFVLPDDTDISSIAPIITISENASVVPESGVAQDFSAPVVYTVTAENGEQKEYTVTLESVSSNNGILSFTFENLAEGQGSTSWIGEISSDIDTLFFRVPYLSPLPNLISSIVVPEGASIEPPSGEELDYTDLVQYTVTAENGEQNEFLVWVDNSLQQLQINNIASDEYRDVAPAGSLTFGVNVLNPIQDSIQVRLKGTQEYDLEIQSVNGDSNEITVLLPNDYLNDRYQLEVSIEHDNLDTSDAFVLDQGALNFVAVTDHVEDGVRQWLVIPSDSFSIDVFLDRSAFDEYVFSLRKNGVDYALLNPVLQSQEERVALEMPPLESPFPETGLDYDLVITRNGVETIFDLTNTIANPVAVIVARPPIVSGTDKTVYTRSESILVEGENLFFDIEGFSSESTLELAQSGNRFFLDSNVLNNAGQQVFDLTTSFIPSGTYTLGFANNVDNDNFQETGIIIDIVPEESDHPTLEVTSAVLYTTNPEKRVIISFSGDISQAVVTKVVLQNFSGEELEITNYFNSGNDTVSYSLTDSEYNDHLQGSDGYVIIEDNGVEYTLPFIRTTEDSL